MKPGDRDGEGSRVGQGASAWVAGLRVFANPTRSSNWPTRGVLHWAEMARPWYALLAQSWAGSFLGRAWLQPES